MSHKKAMKRINQPIHPDHHLINLQYLQETEHLHEVGQYINERIIRPLLQGSHIESDFKVLQAIIHLTVKTLEDTVGKPAAKQVLSNALLLVDQT